MAQGSTRRDVVTKVRKQHDTIRRLFDDVEVAPPARRAQSFQPLVRMLRSARDSRGNGRLPGAAARRLPGSRRD